MRIVIDLQGAQSTASGNRGTGRYALSLAQAIVRNRGEHEVLVVLNGLFPNSVESIRTAFNGLLPQKDIRIWTVPGPVDALVPSNTLRREMAERLYEAFLSSLKPDMVLVSSLFEGQVDDAVTSIGVFSRIPTAVILYDLIPLIYPQLYLENPVVRGWYMRKIDHLRRADLWLAISESSRQDCIDYLGLPMDLVANVSAAAEDLFRITPISPEDELRLRRKYDLMRPFLMYTGGIDRRKNIEGLVGAFARLPKGIRQAHQLVVVCSIQKPGSRTALEYLARQKGLEADELILTGFVPEDDLVALYQLCRLFVFPSWYEGFGLPALEAMRCGAPVIAANSSSLPEVIGRVDSLFDPFSEESIAAKIAEVLNNDDFREELIHHSAEQAKKFSWDECARRAIAFFEQFQARRQENYRIAQLSIRRPKLAYFSPLPPEHSGIADYSAELLPELARHYDIEVIVAQSDVSDSWIKACLPIRTVEWFVKHADSYDRVLYHIGNSHFHRYMFDLLNRYPGTVVLHDFFLSHEKANMPDKWACELYMFHGYAAIWERFQALSTADVIFKYPCNFGVLQAAEGVIVHSSYSVRLAREWYGDGFGDDWMVIPLLRASPARIDPKEARKKLGLSQDDFVVCCLGFVNPTKQSYRLLEAWLSSNLAKDSHCRLIFVGENHGGDYGAQMCATISRSGLEQSIRITGWVDGDTFRHYLAAADMGVQLRTLSRGETSASLLDCLNYGLPTIVNANGSIAELPQDAVWMLPDEFEDIELIEALETLWRNAEKRQSLSARARELILTRHAPRVCADKYAQAIETFYASAQTGRQALIDALARLENLPADEEIITALAGAISQNLPSKQPAHQLLVDISELVQWDAMTGIQRVTRSVLQELLRNPPPGYRVEPVYATTGRFGYRYAREFTLRFLQCPACDLVDDLIEAHPGDIFLDLELRWVEQLDYLKSLHSQGIGIYFLVYDLLPISMPHAFPDGMDAIFSKWLSAIVQFDGALCISRDVADGLSNWLMANNITRMRPFKIGCFHLGADVENSVPTLGLKDDSQQIFAQIAVRPSFIVVGTIEPRKGHLLTIEAFDQLWKQGVEANLIIVGKEGWKSVPDEMRRTIPETVKALIKNPEKGKRLFWLEGISDEYLEKIYAASTCLIAPSDGEGFGLPLIEAAQHKLPIIARDIPVFHEVAGEHAYYFRGKEPGDLAKAVREWLELYQSGRHPKSDDMPWLTWKQSTQQLLDVILQDNWYTEWMPQKDG